MVTPNGDRIHSLWGRMCCCVVFQICHDYITIPRYLLCVRPAGLLASHSGNNLLFCPPLLSWRLICVSYRLYCILHTLFTQRKAVSLHWTAARALVGPCSSTNNSNIRDERHRSGEWSV